MLGRLVRKPAKYCSAAFWRMVLREAAFRGRAACLYTIPSIVRTAGRRRRCVFVTPSAMDRYQFAETYIAWKVFAACDLDVKNTIDARTAVAVAWNPSTCYELPADAFAGVSSSVPVLNAACTDIRKSTVGELHQRVFGYRLEVDPLTYAGSIVRKSERNGAHDGEILNGPLAAIEPGYVYQRVVSFASERGLTEWRVFVVARRAVATYELIVDGPNRFAPNKRVRLTTVDDAFSPEEQRQLAEFCQAAGLDFGGLDVLRDGPGGRIYVTDCNNTPTGPAKKMPVMRQVRFVREVAEHFRRAYLDGSV